MDHNPVRKLPKPLMDKIRWWATEPTPSAKCMYEVYADYYTYDRLVFLCDTWHTLEWPHNFGEDSDSESSYSEDSESSY